MPFYVLAVKKSLKKKLKALLLYHLNNNVSFLTLTNMQRTEKFLKSKGIKTHTPTYVHAYWRCKYDRTYVTNYWDGAYYVPFSRTSRRLKWVYADEHPNRSLRHYLKRFFRKRIGRYADDVFHDFSKLGWKQYVDSKYPRCCYSVDDNGCLTPPVKSPKPKPWYLISYDPIDSNNAFDDDEDDDDDGKSVASRPRASEKRLTRSQLEYNDKIITAKNNLSWYGCGHEILGELYVEINHKVLKRKVFLMPFPVHPWPYVQVKVLGIYREEHVFHDVTGKRVLVPYVE